MSFKDFLQLFKYAGKTFLHGHLFLLYVHPECCCIPHP